LRTKYLKVYQDVKEEARRGGIGGLELRRMIMKGAIIFAFQRAFNRETK